MQPRQFRALMPLYLVTFLVLKPQFAQSIRRKVELGARAGGVLGAARLISSR